MLCWNSLIGGGALTTIAGASMRLVREKKEVCAFQRSLDEYNVNHELIFS